MAKKAYKAFLKGKPFYTYKGQQYAVPVAFDPGTLKNETNGQSKID